MINVRKITDDIFYVGVNDLRDHLFEGLWTLPYGVSYNSYLVVDEKIALIDTVESYESDELVTHLKDTIGDRNVDYLIVNHMEPDHSGSIPEIVRRYPEVKVVGNRQTIGMIKGFYGVADENLMEVTDQQVIPLGKKCLQFHLTPMVHWPETMMTYCPESKVLFTGDAFGTFGALEGPVTDDQLTESQLALFNTEMVRYYACIVAKYNRFVLKAIEKVGGLGFEYLCTTHGPVWHKHLGEIVAKVVDLAKGEGRPGVTIVYGSMYGNTRRLAQRIYDRLAARGITDIRMHDASGDMSRIIADAYELRGLIVGGPTYSMALFPPVDTFMKAMVIREVKNKVFGCFGSFTWAPAAKKELDAYAERLQWPITAGMKMQFAPDAAAFAEADRLADAVADTLLGK